MIPNIDSLDDARIIDIGGSVLTLGGLTSGAIILMVAILLSWLVTRGIRRVRLRAQRSAQLLYLLEKLTGPAVDRPITAPTMMTSGRCFCADPLRSDCSLFLEKTSLQGGRVSPV